MNIQFFFLSRTVSLCVGFTNFMSFTSQTSTLRWTSENDKFVSDRRWIIKIGINQMQISRKELWIIQLSSLSLLPTTCCKFHVERCCIFLCSLRWNWIFYVNSRQSMKLETSQCWRNYIHELLYRKFPNWFVNKWFLSTRA